MRCDEESMKTAKEVRSSSEDFLGQKKITQVREEADSLTTYFGDTAFFHRTLLVISLVLMTGLLLAVIWYASDVLLLLFGGILVAVLLRAPTNWLSKKTALPENVALMLAICALIGTLILLVYLFAAPLTDQAAQLANTLPRALAGMRRWLQENNWARPLQPLMTELTRMKLDFQLVGRASGMISSTFEALIGMVVVVFIGIYLAAQPRLYQRGLMHLLPIRLRPRAWEVFDKIGSVLRWWLIGRLTTMMTVGLMAGLGLWWLQVPLAFTLGVLSGLLEFIPYVGPVLAAIPALLIAFNIDPMLASYVLLLYGVIQGTENYLLTPLVEQRAVALPPALVIFATLLLAALAGPLGVILASPLTAAGIVTVRLLYIEGVVEQPAKP